MKFCACLSLVIGILVSSNVFACSKESKGINPAEVKKALENEGYYASQNMARLHDENTLSEIYEILEKIEEESEMHAKRSHKFGFDENFDLKVKKYSNNFEVVITSSENTSIEYSDKNINTIKQFLHPVFQALPDGKYFVRLNLVSDIADAIKKQEKEMEKHNNSLNPLKPIMRTTSLAKLIWHQDKFPKWGKNFIFDFLYFLLLESKGTTKYSLSLGTGSEKAINRKTDKKDRTTISIPNDSEVIILKTLKGESGAGYFVNQSREKGQPIFHTRTAYRSMICSGEIDLNYPSYNTLVPDLLLTLKNSNFLPEDPEDKTYLSDPSRNFSSPKYERPRRNKVIVRIKTLTD